MRALTQQELSSISGGKPDAPSLKEVTKAALPHAIKSAVGTAITLTLRNAIGCSEFSVEEIAMYAVLSGVTSLGAFVVSGCYFL